MNVSLENTNNCFNYCLNAKGIYKLHEVAEAWLKENCQGKYEIFDDIRESTQKNVRTTAQIIPTIKFELDSDAVMFKLALPLKREK